MSEGEEAKNVFTLEEVGKHKTLKSLWLAIHNKVYDVTLFVDEHPGGEEVLLEQAGQLATEAFEDVGHSEDAHELMKNYYIGELSQEDKEIEYKENHDECEDNPKSLLRSWFIPVAIAIGIIAVAVYKIMSSSVGGKTVKY